MAIPEYEFDELQSIHFVKLARKSVIAALALACFGIANFFILLIAPLEVVHSIGTALLIIGSLFTAISMQQAAVGFSRIANTQGNDIKLLHSSNKRLQKAFTCLAFTMAILCLRYLWAAPVLIKLGKSGIS